MCLLRVRDLKWARKPKMPLCHSLSVPTKETALDAAILSSPAGPQARAVFAWQRAWSLAERLSSFRQIEDKTKIPFDRELAAETLALWRANSPFDKD